MRLGRLICFWKWRLRSTASNIARSFSAGLWYWNMSFCWLGLPFSCMKARTLRELSGFQFSVQHHQSFIFCLYPCHWTGALHNPTNEKLASGTNFWRCLDMRVEFDDGTRCTILNGTWLWPLCRAAFVARIRGREVGYFKSELPIRCDWNWSDCIKDWWYGIDEWCGTELKCTCIYIYCTYNHHTIICRYIFIWARDEKYYWLVGFPPEVSFSCRASQPNMVQVQRWQLLSFGPCLSWGDSRCDGLGFVYFYDFTVWYFIDISWFVATILV